MGERFIRKAIELAASARAKGNHPFGALFVNEAGEIILEAENTVVTEKDCTGHAETNLVRNGSKQLEPEVLQKCTLYTSTEPCAMCSGALYWAGISRLVYGLPESELYKITGTNEENLTLSLPCREIFKCGQRKI